MRYLMMISALVISTATPLFAQDDGVAKSKPAVEKEEKKEKKLSKEVTNLQAYFKGIDDLLADTKVTQSMINSFFAHNASFKKTSEKDATFIRFTKIGLVDAFNHAVAQEWFKTWAADNKIEDGDQWLRNFLRLKTAHNQVVTVPGFKKKKRTHLSNKQTC